MNIPIEPGKFYHIYNHANGRDMLFPEPRNYLYFLEKYNKYISGIADTLAYSLMPNHFHLLVSIKEEIELKSAFPDHNTFENLISKQFANLFSCYTQAFNKVYDRKGSLFMKAFKRKEINSEYYLRKLIVYLHCNPVHHGFVEYAHEWAYSSYNSIIDHRPTKLQRSFVLDLFEDRDNFIFVHKQQAELHKDLALE